MALVGDYQHPGFGRIRLAHDPDRGGLFLRLLDREAYWNFYLTPIADGALHWRAFNTIFTADGEGGLNARQTLQSQERTVQLPSIASED